MQFRRHQQFMLFSMSWFLGTALTLALIDSLTLELFFVVAISGLVIGAELTKPRTISPQWRDRIRWIIIPLLLILSWRLGIRIIEIVTKNL